MSWLSMFHTVSWIHAFILALAVYLYLVSIDRLPEVKQVKYLLSSLNDKGGHILVLVILIIVFFRAGMEMFYYMVPRIENGKIDATNAFVLAGFTFVTGTAFGNAMGALLTSMNATNERGAAPGVRGGDQRPTAVNPSIAKE